MPKKVEKIVRFEVICEEERLSQILSTNSPILAFENSDFQILPYDVPAPAGIKLTKPFPEKETFFEYVLQSATEYMAIFPNCCENHKKLIEKKWFDLKDYKDMPLRAARKMYYTVKHIESRKKDKHWAKDIIDYIDLNVLSFGQVPDEFGSPIGLHFYTKGLRLWLDNYSQLPNDYKAIIDEYLENRNKPKTESGIDFNLLYTVYHKWLSFFPFELEYFKEQKAFFTNRVPLFKGILDYNQYSGAYMGSPHTIESLIEFLNKVTTQSLNKVTSQELVKKGLIDNIDKHSITLINETHRTKQLALLNEYRDDEKKYVDLVSNWLINERDYFLLIAPRIAQKANANETKEERIKRNLKEYGFDALPKVNALNAILQNQLLDLICNNPLPYQIAMLDFLGFFDYLLKQHFKTKYQMFGSLAGWLNDSKDTRGIKGNYYVLNPKSTQNRNRFTAHKHKKKVEKDYQNIK